MPITRALRALVGVVIIASPAAAIAQDGEGGDRGREVLRNVAGAGGVFDFTKLSSDGDPLDNQDAIYTIQSWDCVRDNVTGLMWEVKTADGGLRDQGNTYSWYNANSEENAGDPGVENGGECAGGIDCDTEAYVKAVNQRGLCGYSDWRMPTRQELRSIVDYQENFPAIDTSVFPNTVATSFWTSEPNANYPSFAWHTDFKFGLASYYFFKAGKKGVRLVREASSQ